MSTVILHDAKFTVAERGGWSRSKGEKSSGLRGSEHVAHCG